MNHFRPNLDAHQITEQQWRVIRVLSESGPLDATEVSDRAAILPPSLTRMIYALEKRALITKNKDTSDGRRILLQITATGQAVIDDVMPESLRVYAEIDSYLGAERVEQLLDTLEELSRLKIPGN